MYRMVYKTTHAAVCVYKLYSPLDHQGTFQSVSPCIHIVWDGGRYWWCAKEYQSARAEPTRLSWKQYL